MNNPAVSVTAEILPPLSLKTLKSYASQIFTPIRRGESVTSVWVPMMGRRIRNKFIISYPELFKEELGDPNNYLLVYIEPLELTEESGTGYIRLAIKSIVESYNQKGKDTLIREDFEASPVASYAEILEKLESLVKLITEKGLEIVLFLGEFDEFAFADSIFYNNLKALWSKVLQKLHFIFLLSQDITDAESVKKHGELNSLLLRNLVYVPLLDEKDIEYLIDYFSKQLNRPFSENEIALLKKVCGGHSYLLKSATRLIALMNGAKVSESELEQILTSHFELRSVSQKIFDLLSLEEQNILREIVASEKHDLPEEATVMKNLRLIKQNKDGTWTPFGSLFRSIISATHQQVSPPIYTSGPLVFDEKSGAILLDSNNIEEKFTRQEYEILRFFLKQPDKLRTREEIGEAMWGQESYDKYSDWAIDQVMSKIRRKLKDIGADGILSTIRGRGYKLVLG